MSADLKLFNEDMIGLADSMDGVAARVKANQRKVDKQLSILTAEVTNSFKIFQTQTTSLQHNLSKQIRSFMLELKQEIYQRANVQSSTDDSTKSQPKAMQSPISPKSTRQASSTQFPSNFGKDTDNNSVGDAT